MEAIEVIHRRRSIRKYTQQAVPSNLVKELVRSAMVAPSASNAQDWQFVVINDSAILQKCAAHLKYGAFLKDAALGILVCGDTSLSKSEGYWPQNCSAATQNLLLAATALGLGACWLGVFPREERVAALRQALAIPDHVIPMAMISIGYPGEEKPPNDRYDEAKVHWNKW